MRPSVQGNDTSVVNHLNENDHVFRRLDDLIIIVVIARNHWARQAIARHDATLDQRPILRGVVLAVSASSLCKGVRSLLALWRKGGNSPIRRIDNQRRSFGANDLGPKVPPESIVSTFDVGFGISVA